ncbi:hypothetical protein FB382_003053 [Nocardioides ginsengisegetis]|uniref:Uncharacterized protein n=1 Tax=Nocardioides ginsengisegetis TaxID=661491 RepID=A0A7W3PAR8_9ACTN|nr:hypothetical protein [Nocardioides ginsengisegetis]MBA8804762.1 hypothetical protein [Nocardioides ginsengisegetis]
MTLRWWYLRRGVAWHPLLGCCAAAALVTGLLARWPSNAPAFLPALLALCAAGSAFVYDEAALPVVAVTPRGAAWRRTTRLGPAAAPLGLWTLVVLARPGDLPLQRSGWWLAGAATITLAAGLAALASRREVGAPGSMLAAVLALALVGALVVTSFLGWDSVYPIAGFSGGVWTFWLTLAAGGALALLAALRPGIRA